MHKMLNLHINATLKKWVVSKTTCFFVPKSNKNLDFIGECK